MEDCAGTACGSPSCLSCAPSLASVLFVSDGGAVLCLRHAGGYLTSAVAARPRARVFRTPLGTWERMRAVDAASVACETCVPWNQR